MRLLTYRVATRTKHQEMYQLDEKYRVLINTLKALPFTVHQVKFKFTQEAQCRISYLIRFISKVSNFTKCLKNQPCYIIKMREMRGEVGKNTPNKEIDNPSFLCRHGHMADF